tara:strand:- start:624 stop:1460 length:837 start_codon:yes stop_codon:yes gene_type:complete
MNKLMAFFVFTFICGSMISFTMEGGSGIVTTHLKSTITASQNVIPVNSVTGFLTGGDRITIEDEDIRYNSVQAAGVVTSVDPGADGKSKITPDDLATITLAINNDNVCEDGSLWLATRTILADSCIDGPDADILPETGEIAYTCPCMILTNSETVPITRGADSYDSEETEAKPHAGPDNSKVPPRRGTKVFNRGSSLVNQALGMNIAQSATTAGVAKTFVLLPIALSKTAIKLIAWDFAYLDGNFSYFKYMILYPISAGFMYTILITGANLFQGVFRR